MSLVTKIRIKLLSKFTHGSFARNVLIMFVGTAIGQFTSLLLSPVLTRIYTPELFGILGFFSSLIGILSVISSLRYDMALPITETKKDAANLLAVCCSVLIFTTSVFFGIILFLPYEFINSTLGSLSPYRFLLPIGFLGAGAYQIIVSYATREGAFATISRTKIYQGVSGPISQIGLGVAGMGAWGLIIGFIIGQSAGIANMFVRLVFKPRDVLPNVTWQGMKSMASRFSRFPIISTWSAMINVLGTNSMMMIVIPMLYSSTIAGFIFLTERIIGRPLILISTSILQVYLGEAAKTQASDPVAMRRRFLQIIKGQFFIVSFWLGIINATAFYLIPVVFGKDWADAVIYIHILSICYLPQMIMVAVMNTLQIMEKQALTAMWEFARLVLIVSGFAISYSFSLSAVQALLIYSSSQAVMQVILFGLMYYSIQKLQPKV